jgi:hypothetical protein
MEVYDLASIFESVVTLGRTCIVYDATRSFGVDKFFESRYLTNVVLSLVTNIYGEVSQHRIGAARN